MTDLKQKRLVSLNKLLMEQRPKYAAAFEAGSNIPEPSEKDKSSLVDKIVTGIELLLTYEGGKGYLAKALKKAGIKGGEEVVKKGLLRRTLSKLSFRSLLLLAKEIIAFQQFSAMPVRALHGGAVAGLRSAVAAYGAAPAVAAVAGSALAATAIGIGLNKLFSSPDLDKEVKERLDKAKEDINYAKAELDVYCKGTGALCRDDVDCSGKPGGYEYNKASGYEETLGLGTGRELFGVPGFRTFKQTPMSFHSNDGAMMIGLAFALVLDDMKNGKITLPNEENKLKKAELKQGSVLKEYEGCVKNWLTQSRVMLAQVKKLGMEKAYKELRFVYGIDALPDLPKEKEEEAASTAGSEKAAAGGQKCDALPLEPGCEGKAVRNILAVLIRGTESGQKYFQNNEEEVGKVYNASIYNDQWLKIVSNILGNGTDEEKQLLNNFLKTKSIRKYRDPLMLYIDKIAKEKLNLTESLKRSKIPLYNSPVHPLYEQRLRTLNKKLMEK